MLDDQYDHFLLHHHIVDENLDLSRPYLRCSINTPRIRSSANLGYIYDMAVD